MIQKVCPTQTILHGSWVLGTLEGRCPVAVFGDLCCYQIFPRVGSWLEMQTFAGWTENLWRWHTFLLNWLDGRDVWCPEPYLYYCKNQTWWTWKKYSEPAIPKVITWSVVQYISLFTMGCYYRVCRRLVFLRRSHTLHKWQLSETNHGEGDKKCGLFPCIKYLKKLAYSPFSRFFP